MSTNLIILLLSAFAAASGLIFNGFIVCVLLWEKRIKTIHQLILLQLACVDIAFCTLILANTSFAIFAVDAIESISTNSHLVFECQGFFWTLLPLILIWTVCGLSCDRYFAICSPLHYNSIVTRKRVIKLLILLWILSLILCSLPFFNVCSYSYSRSRFTSALFCDVKSDNSLLVTPFVIIYIAVTTVTPISFIFACNLQTFLIARHHRHRITSVIYEITLRAQANVVHQTNPQYLAKAKRRNAVFTVSQLITIAFNVPFHIIFAFESLSNETMNPMFVSLLTVLLTFTPSINGYVYGVKSKLVKQTFKRLLQRYLYTKQASLEIDRRLSLRSQSSIKTLSNLQSFLSMNAFTGKESKQTTRRNSAPNVFECSSSEQCEFQTPLRCALRRQSLSFQENGTKSQYSPFFVSVNKAAQNETLSRLTPIRESLNQSSHFL